jgi:uncharacterized repeat protein (TIGR01451 family)
MRTAGELRALVRQGLCTLLVGGAAMLLAPGARAAGTAAGTLIGNTATLNFTISGRPPQTTSASAPAVVVAKVLGVVVTWQDAAPVTASSPDAVRPLTFVVTNTGNGPEPYRLARADTQPGDQFDPVPAASGSLWLESGAQPGFQAAGPNADVPYTPGANDPSLAADASRTVYVVSDIPAGQSTAASGRSALSATATTPGAAGAAPGTLLGTFGGVQTVAGAATSASATGSYLVSGVSVGLAKGVATVRDPTGGTRVMTGTVLTYRIVLSVTGIGVADALSLSDPLPAGLSYVPGSLLVDGNARTDANDADGAAVSGSTVTADFGNVTAPAQRVLEFKATVN